MCLGIAGQIVELFPPDSDLAQVDVFGVTRTVNVGLVKQEGLAAGDWVLIHVGFAIAKMDADEAIKSQAFLRGMGEAHRRTFVAEGDPQSDDNPLDADQGKAPS